ncbi:MAG: hypothetical protein LJE85_12285, partial [Gammaproteobacteria bacterium]|nr:hypothetical protein [Gammaproteobacteria bacterium]
MNTRYRLFRSIYIAIFLGMLVACSGGGDSTPATKPDTKVSGAAVKGIIKNARVEVFPVVNGQVASEPVVTTTTGDDGSYEFTLPADHSGPVMVVVSDNGDSNNPSTMTCDVTGFVPGCGTVDDMGIPQYAFGDDMPLGDLQLKTLIANVSGGSSQTAAVTPYTHMAAAYAEQLAASGSLNAETIAQANSKVGNMLGINNIVTSVPPDITQMDGTTVSVNAAKYALLSAAIAYLANDQFSHNITDAINALVATYTANDGELISAESENVMNIVSLAELANYATYLSNLVNVDSRVRNELSSLNQIAMDSGHIDQPTQTEPSPTSGLGELETVKAFVADIRTWGNVISDDFDNNDTGQLQQQVDMAQVTVNEAAPLFNDVFDHAINAAVDAYISGADLDLAQYFDPNDPVSPIVADGSAVVSGTNVVLDGTIDGVAISFTLQFPPLDGSNLIGTSFNFTMSSGTMQNNAIQASIESGTVEFVMSESTDITPWVNGTYTTDFPDPDSGSLSLTNVVISEINKADPISFTGNVNLVIVGSKGTGETVVRDTLGNVVQYNPQTFTLTGELSNAMNSFEVHIAGTMPNADTFMPIQTPNVPEENGTNFREISDIIISFT